MVKPKLRFPEFTNEWEEKQLKDFMVFKNGLNADKDKFGSGIKFISVMDILNNPFITYDIIRGKVDVDEKTLDNYNVTYGDVLFQRSSETREDAGKSNVYLDKKNTATFGGFVIRGKKTGDYSPEFMNSLLKSPKVRKEITSKAQGAQHINVGQETLENVSIILPTIKEQERIAEFLSSIDDIIQVHGEEITALEEQKKGIMQKLFNREVRFKADDGSEYPEWEEKKLGELFDISAGGDIDKEHSMEYQTERCCYPVFANALTDDGLYGYADYYKVTGDTITVTGRGDVGHAVARHCAYVPIVRLLVLTPMQKECVDFFANQINITKIFIESTGVPQLTSPQLKKIVVKRPAFEEQQKIADCLLTYDETIQIKKDKLEVWKKIKKGLLQQMFV